MANTGPMPSRNSTKKKATEPTVKVQSIEERTAYLEERLKAASAEVQSIYRDDLDMGWIAHDSAAGQPYLAQYGGGLTAVTETVRDTTLLRPWPAGWSPTWKLIVRFPVGATAVSP